MSDDKIGICARCEESQLLTICCMSHMKVLCHACYRRTHFVEVCGCSRCDRDGLPRVYPERVTS